MKDKLGQEITPGCYIAYGHALGRCAGLRVGVVLAVKEASPESKSWRPDCRITVRGINDDWKTPALLSKASTLMFPDRVVVLPEGAVPQAYRDMLNQAKDGPQVTEPQVMTQVTYPFFEMSGDPCPIEGCQGVLVQTITTSRPPEFYKECHVCRFVVDRAPAEQKMQEAQIFFEHLREKASL
jgi:hypothetical protein